MALTKAQLAWCAAIFAAGTVTPPAIQKAKVHVTKAQGKPAARAVKEPQKAASPRQTASPTPIMDCPMPSVPSFDGNLEYRLEPMWSEPWPQGSFVVAQPPIGGGGGFLPPVAPRVPEPGAWVMLIAGFGFVGVSLRKRKSEQNA